MIAATPRSSDLPGAGATFAGRGAGATGRLLWIAALFGAVWTGLELAVPALFHAKLTLGLHFALATIGFEIASGTLALWLAPRPSAPPLPSTAPRLSVLVAAYDEVAGIVATLRSLREQTGIELEIVVADDGSTDGTAEAVVRAFDLAPAPGGFRSAEGNLTVLTLPHRGKGVALNAAVAVARHPILVTVDADTYLAPLALARLATAFADPLVAAATGSVLVTQHPSLLTRFQQIEYVRNTLIRVAWAELSALEQLPGAFMAMRADWVRAVGGYPTASLTEDYELVYRFYARAAAANLPIRVAAVPTACAYTEAPIALPTLMRQRTRWFAGFLTTLVLFRQMIGRPKARVFGLVKLPIKVLDAFHPALSLLSLLVLGFDTGFVDLRPLAASLFCLRWVWDSFTLAMAVRFARQAGAEIELGRAGSLWPWVYVLADGVSYFWLRQVAVLRAYGWVLRPPQGWRSVRGRASSSLPVELSS